MVPSYPTSTGLPGVMALLGVVAAGAWLYVIDPPAALALASSRTPTDWATLGALILAVLVVATTLQNLVAAVGQTLQALAGLALAAAVVGGAWLLFRSAPMPPRPLSTTAAALQDAVPSAAPVERTVDEQPAPPVTMPGPQTGAAPEAIEVLDFDGGARDLSVPVRNWWE